MVKLLVNNVNMNVKNLDGLTAMDIFHLQGPLQNTDIGKILHKAKAKKASDLTSNMTLGGYFSKELLSTYQAGLSPPGGYWQDDYIPPPANNGTTTTNNSTTSLGQGQRAHRAGQMIMTPSDLFYFLIINGLAFHLSVWMILVITLGLPYSKLLSTSTFFLLLAYYASVVATFPTLGSVRFTDGRLLYITLTYISTLAVYYIPLRAFSQHRKLKRRVDTMRGSSLLVTPEN
ncbi:hypothetical protein V6N13_076928 [Hibiscus sabdariffa]